MKPGINLDIPERVYHELYAASNSRLKYMLKSPGHCRFAIDHPEPPTPAMILGSAVDCLVFTPSRFNKQFLCFGQCIKLTAKGARCSNTATKLVGEDQVCGIHGKDLIDDNTRQPLTTDEFKLARACADAVQQHCVSKALLDACDEFQVSLLWDYHGLPCKARLDGAAWSLDGGTIIDLKTTSPRGADDNEEAFSRAIFSLGYHRQGAFYRWSAQACGKQVANFVNIVVDKDEVRWRLNSGASDLKLNQCVAVYRLRDEALFYGELEITPLLNRYRECWLANEWPYAEEIIDISIPAWAERKIERSLA